MLDTEREEEGGGGGREGNGNKVQKIVIREIGKERRDRGTCNEILANAFVFATWLHCDVAMGVIGGDAGNT